MNDLITFLNARLDQDEAAGRQLVEHKRRVLAKAAEAWNWYWYQGGELSKDGGGKYRDGTTGTARNRWEAWEMVLRDLAAVYSDHPDFRQEWRP